MSATIILRPQQPTLNFTAQQPTLTFSAAAQQGLRGADSGHTHASIGALRGDTTVVGGAGGAVVTTQVRGYTADNDGGGGAFMFDPSSTLPDDGGTIIRPTHIGSGSQGRWLRLDHGDIDPLWFGAAGTGSTNDAAFVLAAYAASIAHNKPLNMGGSGRSYLLNTALAVTDSNAHIKGDGATLINGSSSQYTISAIGSADEHLSKIKIRDLNFDRAGGIGSSSNSAVFMSYVDDVRVRDCRSDNAGLNGIDFHNCTDIILTDYDVYSPHAFGIFAYQCVGMRWNHCLVDGAGFWGFQPKDSQNWSVVACEARNCTEYGFYTWDDGRDSLRTTDGEFNACIAHHNGKDGFFLNAVARPSMIGCISHDNAWSGASISPTCSDVNLTGGSYYSNGVSGIGIAADHTTVTGATIRQNAQSGIELTASYCSVVGNTCTDNAWMAGSLVYSDVRLTGTASYNTISGNTFARLDTTNSKSICGVDEHAGSTCDYNVVSNNASVGHSSVEFHRQGANSLFNNPGFPAYIPTVAAFPNGLTPGTGATLKAMNTGTVNVDPPFINAGVRGAVGITITGVTTGDALIFQTPTALENGLVYDGYAIGSTNFVTIYLQNTSAGSINGAALDWRYTWIDLT